MISVWLRDPARPSGIIGVSSHKSRRVKWVVTVCYKSNICFKLFLQDPANYLICATFRGYVCISFLMVLCKYHDVLINSMYLKVSVVIKNEKHLTFLLAAKIYILSNFDKKQSLVIAAAYCTIAIHTGITLSSKCFIKWLVFL